MITVDSEKKQVSTFCKYDLAKKSLTNMILFTFWEMPVLALRIWKSRKRIRNVDTMLDKTIKECI